jgi:hypothetical protein
MEEGTLKNIKGIPKLLLIPKHYFGTCQMMPRVLGSLNRHASRLALNSYGLISYNFICF